MVLIQVHGTGDREQGPERLNLQETSELPTVLNPPAPFVSHTNKQCRMEIQPNPGGEAIKSLERKTHTLLLVIFRSSYSLSREEISPKV